MPKPDQIKKGRRNAQKLIQSDTFEQALLKIDEDESAFESAKQKPKQWFKDQGVEFPGDPTVRVEEGSYRIGCCWGDWCIWFEW